MSRRHSRLQPAHWGRRHRVLPSHHLAHHRVQVNTAPGIVFLPAAARSGGTDGPVRLSTYETLILEVRASECPKCQQLLDLALVGATGPLAVPRAVFLAVLRTRSAQVDDLRRPRGDAGRVHERGHDADAALAGDVGAGGGGDVEAGGGSGVVAGQPLALAVARGLGPHGARQHQRDLVVPSCGIDTPGSRAAVAGGEAVVLHGRRQKRHGGILTEAAPALAVVPLAVPCAIGLLAANAVFPDAK
mmetsp:Transcript_46492/g.149357  ORF Transcript_46492/g.149357 Transcript_46492/m.149357 type:complete len:245 (+) Transcript_46492:706-1440(+)